MSLAYTKLDKSQEANVSELRLCLQTWKGWNNSKVGRMLILHGAGLSPIPSGPYGRTSPVRSDPWVSSQESALNTVLSVALKQTNK